MPMSLTMHVRPPMADALVRFLRRRHGFDDRAETLQQHRQHVARVGIVFNDQDVHAVSGARAPLPIGCSGWALNGVAGNSGAAPA